MLIVRLRGDARVESGLDRLRAHCGCLGGGETMPVDGMEGNVANVDRVPCVVILVTSVVDVRTVLRDPSQAVLTIP